MYIVTYALRDEERGSECFYADASALADEVLAQTRELTNGITGNYRKYLSEKGKGSDTSVEALGFELLILGVLWNVYSGDSSVLHGGPQQLLSGLARLREQGGSLKPGIDFIRGILSTILLSPNLYDNMYISNPSINQLDKLLDWLDATGEFKWEVVKLLRWREYMDSLKAGIATDIIATAITFASWFEMRSLEVLGRYTVNVDRYLNELRPDKYWHEDVIFCGRRRVEYHLNMVGAEIMNRVYREAFIKTSKKLVLLPACMRLLPDSKCKAQKNQSSMKCVSCTAGCGVNELSKTGVQYGFDVLIVPHESSISSSNSDRGFLGEDTGVIGIACVLNLIAGGFMLEEMGIPAQCVILDYCGCKSHWNREGIPTGINVNQLLSILF